MTQQKQQQKGQTRVHYDYDSEEEWYGDDDYAGYDDFQAGSRGGGGSGCASKKSTKRQTQRGGGGGSGTIYSSKHIRAKEGLRLSRK